MTADRQTMITGTFYTIKLVGPKGHRQEGCNKFTVKNPDGDTSIRFFSHDKKKHITLNIPEDGNTFYIMNGQTGATIDRYPQNSNKER